MAASSMSRPFSLGAWLLHRLPRNRTLARITRAYLSWYRSDNNVWADSNGEFDLIRAVAPVCLVVLDVGANVGDWSREALKINPDLAIHCFEAAPDNFATLAHSDLVDRAVLNHLAVSSDDGEITLSLFGENSPLNSTVVPDTHGGGAAGRTITVKSTSLDSYMREAGLKHVDYVKIDVEGAEMPVVKGMSVALRGGAIDAVQFEYGPFSIYGRTFLRDFFEILHSVNFDLYKISQPKLLRFDTYQEAFDNFSHQNWVAVRRGTVLASIIDQRSISRAAL